jgi:hypothetical protein
MARFSKAKRIRQGIRNFIRRDVLEALLLELDYMSVT